MPIRIRVRIPNTDLEVFIVMFCCSILFISRAYEGCKVEVAGPNGGCACATLLFLFSLPLLKVHNPDMALETFSKHNTPSALYLNYTRKTLLFVRKNTVSFIICACICRRKFEIFKKLITMMGVQSWKNCLRLIQIETPTK
jgi:hypothetical protein